MKLVSSVETNYNKDVAEFNAEELEELLYSFNCKTVPAVKSKISMLRNYVYWEAKSGYLPSKNIVIDLPRFIGDNVGIYVNNTAVITQYITEDEMNALISSLADPRDQVVLCLLYEGVFGDKFDELRYLKKEDLDFQENSILVYGKDRTKTGRKIYCNEKTMQVLKNAITSSNTGAVTNSLVKDLFRNIRKPDWGVDCYTQYLSASTIRDSGIFNCLLKKEQSLCRQLKYREIQEVLIYFGISSSLASQYKSKFTSFKKKFG